ncbi:hypothetical protein MWU78_21950 [Arenibacter sp. F26102]|uniref:DUF6577 family protein n=1 Tax=Arenibacter sp. F26102 TaxID=2926416 RepID=UPI001FF37768|nr:DUF6577 family protein [Arenibacter sp. F26102]MCK0148322.1 hypothetical protein [Arenibacter sp. F26102]
MPKIIENRLIEEFKNKDVFSREELFDFYRHYEPNLKEGTFGWRIYDLKKKNVIKSVRTGYYTISYKPKYKPNLSGEVLKLARIISERFDDVKFCLWETDWVNEFAQHQSGKKIVIIEIEKDFVESLYYELKDSFQFDLYINPDEKAIDFYISESQWPVVIKKLITRSPISKRSEKKVTFYTPQLEKILVDLFTEQKLFYIYQGAELAHIYENALKNYTLNYTRLFSYAKRRDKEQDIKQFMTNNLFHLVKDVIE